MLEIYIDGGTIGHNGRLGTVSKVKIGVYIPSLHIQISKEMSGISNNEAEFLALETAMIWCIGHREKNVRFNSDSMIVINRANGKRPKNKKHQNERMDNFQDTILNLSKGFDKVEFRWIPREQNGMADILTWY